MHSETTSHNGLIQGASSSFSDLIGGRQFTAPADSPHGTTIVAARYADGVLVAGDRRATMGNHIALHDVEKVFGADTSTIIGIAGAAGLAFEMVKLFQVELEHFEKLEGAELSFDGKANRLGALIRQHLPQAMHGVTIIPLFAGWDVARGHGRMFTYDGTGGRYEEDAFAAIGSGASYARSSLKKLHDPEADEYTCAATLLQALFDAADDDAGTGGLDLTRNVLPIVMRASADGVARWQHEGVKEIAERVVAGRSQRHGGPKGAAL